MPGEVKSQAMGVFRRLAVRFNLLPTGLPGFAPGLAATIVPITNIDDLLLAPKIDQATIAITGTGTKLVYTVPAGKRWTVKTIYISVSTGTWTFDRIKLTLPDDSVDSTNELWASATAKVSNFNNKDYILEQGWKIQVGIDSFSVSGNLSAQLLYYEEDSFLR